MWQECWRGGERRNWLKWRKEGGFWFPSAVLVIDAGSLLIRRKWLRLLLYLLSDISEMVWCKALLLWCRLFLSVVWYKVYKLGVRSNRGRFLLYLKYQHCQSFCIFFFFFALSVLPWRSILYLALYFLKELICNAIFNVCIFNLYPNNYNIEASVQVLCGIHSISFFFCYLSDFEQYTSRLFCIQWADLREPILFIPELGEKKFISFFFFFFT